MQVDTDQTTGQNERTALYRHLDKSGRLLYVGISLDAIARLNDHMHDSAWSRDISMVVISWFDTRSEALEAERRAIISEKPMHNKQHNRPESQPKPVIVYKEKETPPPPDRAFDEINTAVVSRVLRSIRMSRRNGISRKDVYLAVSHFLTKMEAETVIDGLIGDGRIFEEIATTPRGGRPGKRLYHIRDEANAAKAAA